MRLIGDLVQKDTMSSRFDKNFPPQKLNSPNSIKTTLKLMKIDDVFYYRQDKYMYPELRKVMQSKDTLVSMAKEVCQRK